MTYLLIAIPVLVVGALFLGMAVGAKIYADAYRAERDRLR